MARARTMPPPAPGRPAHMAPDPWAHARAIAAPLGPQAADAVADLARVLEP
jgi:hypothetical protein